MLSYGATRLGVPLAEIASRLQRSLPLPQSGFVQLLLDRRAARRRSRREVRRTPERDTQVPDMISGLAV